MILEVYRKIAVCLKFDRYKPISEAKKRVNKLFYINISCHVLRSSAHKANLRVSSAPGPSSPKSKTHARGECGSLRSLDRLRAGNSLFERTSACSQLSL